MPPKATATLVALICSVSTGCILLPAKPGPAARVAIVVDQTGGSADLSEGLKSLLRVDGRRVEGLPRGSAVWLVPVREDKIHAMGEVLSYQLSSERALGDSDLVQLTEQMQREVPAWLKRHGPDNRYAMSDIRGAVDLARQKLGSSGRRVLIVLSDGLDTADGRNPTETFEGVDVYFLLLPTADLAARTQAERVRNQEFWVQLFERLGARVTWRDDGVKDLKEVLDALAR